MTRKHKRKKQETHLIIGGCGFIGSNLAKKLLKKRRQVIIFDNLSRKGSEKNLEWLSQGLSDKDSNNFHFIKGDITKDFDLLFAIIKSSNYIYHLAAQVAVTTSVTNPRFDFETNALGTLNVLEAIRLANPQAKLIYSSTNKVYGGMEKTKVSLQNGRYTYPELPKGINENQPLDFHSPYGCSKGSGDQYVRDYARIYKLKTVVFRQSCIYGTRQFGVEDQGWISWFVIALLTGKKVTIYGDGKQVRDVLFVDDLLRAYGLAMKKMDKVKGQVFNVGGGVDKSISIWDDFKLILEKNIGRTVKVKRSDWRPGDQKIYISDNSKAKSKLGWEPKITPDEGIKRVFDWTKKNLELFL